MENAYDNLKPFVDELGTIKAQMVELEQRYKQVVAHFAEAGIDSLEGDMFRVVISQVEESIGTDWKTVAMKLNPSRQLIAGNQKLIRKGYTRINIYARTGGEC